MAATTKVSPLATALGNLGTAGQDELTDGAIRCAMEPFGCTGIVKAEYISVDDNGAEAGFCNRKQYHKSLADHSTLEVAGLVPGRKVKAKEYRALIAQFTGEHPSPAVLAMLAR